jgi:meso-butanediol dehydrogenase/(S,S)-butanediol dehydrogenase/diacetyl reductase
MPINTTSVFVLCQAALPHLVSQQGRHRQHRFDCRRSRASPTTSPTAASKHAVVGDHQEPCGRSSPPAGVRVNAICPGAVATPMTATMPTDPDIDWPLVMRNAPKLPDGTCQPEDIAELFAFLASDKARKVTGSLYTMDGGQMAG